MTITTRTAPSISFTDRSYELSHLTKPRGRGAWAFKVSGTDLLIWTPSLTFTDAKKHAKARAIEMHRTGEIAPSMLNITLATQP